MSKRVKLVDLFCGAGGFSRGFYLAGFTPVLGIDNDKSSSRSYSANFKGAEVWVEDIAKVSSKEIERAARKIDVIIGSPPCEPFTPANPRRMKEPLDRLYKDPVGRLVLHFIRIVGDLKPKVFVMENVPGIAEGPLKEAISREFARVGYEEVHFNVLKAEDYCTPSHRRRVFISNIRIRPKIRCRKYVKVIEALKGLPPPNDYYPPNHQYINPSKRLRKLLPKTRWNQALIYYEGFGGKRYPNLIRLHPYKLAPTVLGSSRFIHPFEDRLLTVREQAKLMGYPDYHIFFGGKEEQYNQVGESVPPPLAKAIAQEVLRHLGIG